MHVLRNPTEKDILIEIATVLAKLFIQPKLDKELNPRKQREL